MEPLSFSALTLRGFGLYREEKVIDFHPGVNVLVAQNEHGKSTLAFGLAAIIFGLPVSSDEGSFGTARFRNWDDAPAFSGELLFNRDNREYHIARDFASQSIKVRTREPAGAWTDLVRGIHNPRATKPNVKYLEFLRNIFGLQSMELFRQTFFIEQPLPEGGAISAELQQLLSGGGHFTVVLERLKSELKTITRSPHLYYDGVNPGRKNQQIEVIEQEITRFEDELSRGTRDLAQIQQMSQELTKVTAELRKAEKAVERTSKVGIAFEQWDKLRLHYTDAQDKKRKLESAVQHIEVLMQKEAEVMEQRASGSNMLLTQMEQAIQVTQKDLAEMAQELFLPSLNLELQESPMSSDTRVGDEILGAVKDAEQRLRELEGKLASACLLQEQVSVYLGQSDGWPEDTAAKAERLRDLREQSKQEKKPHSPRSLWPWLATVCGALFYAFWGYHNGLLGGILSLLVVMSGVLLYYLTGRPQSITGCQAEIARLETELPGLAGLPVSQLTVLSLQLRQLEEASPYMFEVEITAVRERLDMAIKTRKKWQSLIDATHHYQEERTALKAQLMARQTAVAEALRANDVHDLEELQDRLKEAEDEQYFARREWKEHIALNPGLPAIEETKDQGAVFARFEGAKVDAREAVNSAQELDVRQRELAIKVSRLEGATMPDLAVAEERLAELRVEEQRLHFEAEATGLAAGAVDSAIKEFQETYLERLATGITGYFEQITRSGRVISIDPKFALTVTESSGQRVAIEQLSQGARDQLYLALRLGIADLTAEDAQIPMVLDDPFLTSDEHRLLQIKDALHSLGRQVWLLTHSDSFAQWGNLTQ